MKGIVTINHIILFLITVLGAVIRFNNISPFKLYPDSYQNLLVSENIRTYHSVLGYLGSNGMLYPDFFMWTRPGYALLILIANAQFIAFFAGVIAIPLVYCFIKSVLGSKRAGLAGALLLAISFNHTIWSGFIMTETTGVLFMTLSLGSLFYSLKNKPSWGDFLTGLLFSFAVLARYEYVIILLPMSLLIFFTTTRPYPRLLSILSAFLFSICIVAMQLFPMQSASVLLKQLPDLLLIGVGLGIVGVVTMLFFYRKPPVIASDGRSAVTMTLVVLTIFFFLGKTGALSAFAAHDFLITLFFFIGILLMLQQSSLRMRGLFVIFSIISLGAFYYRTNPEMERYITHLLPFLIIPASYGLSKLNFRQKPLVLLVIALAILQGFFSYGGLRYLQDDSWYRMSYEEKAAGMVRKYVPQDALLLVSLPEPYFYTLRIATHSIANAAPFVYIPDSLNTKEIVIVEDMGMHAEFPAFTTFLDTQMQDKKITQFRIDEKFHVLNKSKEEKYPVILYKTTVGELKNRINKKN